MSEKFRPGPFHPEIDVLDEQVGRYDKVFTRILGQDRTVVAHPT
jgi:hypothetical protein